MVAQPPPAGVYVPVPTFFDAANRLDLETQGAHAIYLARAGITGIVVLGSTGELAAVAASERTTLVRGLRARLNDAGFRDYPLVAGTGAQAVEEVREQLVETAAAGAQWGMCLVPSYHAQVMAQDGIVDWFTAVADQSPIPILIYHYPSVSNNVQVAASCLIKLAQHPNIVGCKLSHGDVSRLAQVALNPTVQKTDFHVFTGLGQLLLPAMSVGCSGAIDAAAAFFPRTLVRLYALAAEPRPGNGQLAERQQMQLAVCCVEELLVRHGVVAVKEAVSRLRGFGAPHATRLPLAGGIPGGEAEWQKWTGALEALERIEASLDG